jgi:hypothetical protein
MLPAVLDCITLGLAEALGREPARGELTSDETALAHALLREGTGTHGDVAGRTATPA